MLSERFLNLPQIRVVPIVAEPQAQGGCRQQDCGAPR